MELQEREKLFHRADALTRREDTQTQEGLREFYLKTRRHDWEGAEKVLNSLEAEEFPTVFSFLKSKGVGTAHLMHVARNGNLLVDGTPHRDPHARLDFKSVSVEGKVYKADT